MSRRIAILLLSAPDHRELGFHGFCQDTILLGRTPKTSEQDRPDLALTGDTHASRPHAKLVLKDATWHLEDLESTNGTFVDGARISGAIPLEPGALVQTGSTFWTLCTHDRLMFRYGQLLFVGSFHPAVSRPSVQNQLPILWEVSVLNLSNRRSEECHLDFQISDLCDPIPIRIPPLESKERRAVKLPNVRWVPWPTHPAVRHSPVDVVVSAGGTRLESYPSQVDVLGYWGWAQDPRLFSWLSAFVIPEHSALQALATKVAESQRHSRSPGQAQTELLVYRCAMEHLARFHKIRYQLPKLETTRANNWPFQTIRPPGSLLSTQSLGTGEGTCIDLALLLSSLAERLALFPLLVLCGESPSDPSHALAGIWTGGSPGQRGLIPKAALINRLDQGHIHIVEPTSIAVGTEAKQTGFEEGLARGRARLQESPWAVGIDVGYLRKAPRPICPLPC